MLLTKTARSVIALVAIFTLLMCEGAWAAHEARYAAASGTHMAATAAGCHAPGDSDIPAGAGPTPCESAQAPIDFYHVPAVILTVVAFAFALSDEACAAHHLTGVTLTPFAGAPPPLHLVHCRLRN